MEVKQKKVDSSLQRGRAAEVRLLTIIHSLRKRVPWIGTARLAGWKHDRLGVDILVSIKALSDKDNVIVPLQVKSSIEGLIQTGKKLSDSRDPNIILLVVNEFSDDEVIERRLVKLLTAIR